MAGLTSGIPFKPFIFRTKTTSSPLYFSLDSQLFGVRLCSPTFSKCRSFSSSLHRSVTARYGGYRSSGDAWRSRQRDSDDDQALDVSSIRSASVRLIDEQQNMVVLSPDADPPVVRIMDYNKYRYELQKKKRGQQKKSAANRMDLKELKMGYNIDSHDYSVRLKAARKFLQDGDKVKIIVNLKGRENEFRNIAIELIRRFQNDVGELATEESKNFSVRNIFIVLVPNKALLQKGQESSKKTEKSAATEISAGV
ncbi:translation initiation factor IF3-4, chloroplastic isoform X2 [Vitis vinifera]|uniref:translation initiation factor IF3-4, chloroplastic isoform X2 n=1 Tax=Vitis vinifera TaxID=29760 RepID=UPI00053F7956|nr:translation initiation factor IF3-4, chloroplastic isoform X2 [Vitis vinifera]|eukprot:XP_010656621.1 PREDICTED: uncharacterized protein LOC100243384 isoform X3 [Vitis vinifera]